MKRCNASAPALMSRRRCTLPLVKLNVEIPALGMHSAPRAGSRSRLQLKLFLPLIKLLSGIGIPGGLLGKGASCDATILSEVL